MIQKDFPGMVMVLLLVSLVWGSCGDKKEKGQVGCAVDKISKIRKWGDVEDSFLPIGDITISQAIITDFFDSESFFGNVSASFKLFVEDDPDHRNVYVTADGFILLGFSMFQIASIRTNTTSVVLILGHAWAHRRQQEAGWATNNMLAELEADAFAAYYVSRARSWFLGLINDYYTDGILFEPSFYHDPAYHGSSDQRLAAVNIGFDNREVSPDTDFQNLHDIFINRINAEILN